MLTVSEDYKKEIKNRTRQFNLMTALSDSELHHPGNIKPTVTYSNEADISNIGSVISLDPLIYNYASLENNYFLLDGSFILPNRSNNIYTGFIGEDVGCSIKITTYYTRLYDKLTIFFYNGYATNFTVVYYQESQEYSRQTFTNDKERITIEVPNFSSAERSMEIIINSWSIEGQRPRIRKLLNGEAYIFENNNNVSFDLMEETDLQALSIPTNTFSITLDNYDRKFDILDTNNILNKLKTSSQIKSYLGLNINGVYEYVYVGDYFYQSYDERDDKKLELNYVGYTDYYYKLNNIPIHTWSESTTKNNALEIINAVPTNKSVLNYTGNIPLKYLNNETKQDDVVSVMSFYNGSLKIDRGTDWYGNSAIALFDNFASSNEEYIINLTEQTRNPKFTKYAKTQKIIFRYNDFGAIESSKQDYFLDYASFTYSSGLYIASITFYTDTKVDVQHLDIYSGDTLLYENGASRQSGVSIEYSESFLQSFFRHDFRLRVQTYSYTTQKIKISATPYDKIEIVNEVTNPNVITGVTVELNNETIRTASDRQRISNYIFNLENTYPLEFETEILGDIRLGVGDKIKIEGPDGYHNAIISSINTKFDGGTTQYIKGIASNE